MERDGGEIVVRNGTTVGMSPLSYKIGRRVVVGEQKCTAFSKFYITPRLYLDCGGIQRAARAMDFSLFF